MVQTGTEYTVAHRGGEAFLRTSRRQSKARHTTVLKIAANERSRVRTATLADHTDRRHKQTT
jgi:hypothetical protein